MTNLIVIKVSKYINRFIRKCIDYKINLFEVNYIDEDNILVKIRFDDYSKVKRLNYYSNIKIIKYEGTKAVENHFKKHIYLYLIIIFCFILMDFITNFIVEVNIIHENSQVRKLVKDNLLDSGIGKISLAKDFDELNIIKNNILENNPNTLEWLSITRKGMTYEVRIEERIITKIIKDEGYAHLVASKDALITKIASSKGSVLVRSGEYVKKGDILISGEIKLYEEVKGNVLAKGEVYGDVWYTTDISYPMEKEEKEYTDKKRFNISFNNKILFRNKFKFFAQTKLKKIKILGMNISFYNEEEYKLKTIKYTEEEVINLSLKKIEKEFLIKLNGKGRVISQKVLKKEENNSTMLLRVFVITNELISNYEYYDIGSDNVDPETRN
ncbi:MAG: sporulation protein YqfD [Bacilli bacterium]|nr:sporulation protein YqfD [Bacilli bacterium]